MATYEPTTITTNDDGTISIVHTRGDTLSLKLTILQKDGTEYVPVTGDVIEFGMKKNFKPTTEYSIHKIIPIDTMTLLISSSDTSSLNYGTYVFDCQITLTNGHVRTFMKGTIKLTDEVVTLNE